MTLQRYISKELIHFVGRECKKLDGTDDEEAKYDLLINKIIKNGIVSHFPHDSSSVGNINTNPNMRVSENKMYETQCVCFCDIPLQDLAIHAGKYGRFAISFRKEFMLTKGVQPVFYVPREALISSTGLARREKDITLAEYADRIVPYVDQIFLANPLVGMSIYGTPVEPIQFMSRHVFAQMKFFDANTNWQDENNYYMEREWRHIGVIKFTLDDVYRIIIPETFSRRLNRDLPDYSGQITFIEPLVE